MNRLDETRPFIPLRIAILTMSDTRTAAEDKSGDALAEMATASGHGVAARALLKDDANAIRAKVASWIADPDVDVVITTGGTGFTGRDVRVAPERGREEVLRAPMSTQSSPSTRRPSPRRDAG